MYFEILCISLLIIVSVKEQKKKHYFREILIDGAIVTFI